MNALHFDFGISMLSEYDADGFLGLQVDLFGEQKAGAPTFEMHAPYGLYSRPLDPDKDVNANPVAGACTVLRAWEGSRGHAWTATDLRVIPKLPPLTKGGSMQYGATGSFWVMDGQTGTQVGYVPYAFTGPPSAAFPNGTPTKSLTIELNVDSSGQESISIVHGDGMAITMTAGAKHSVVIKNKTGAAFLEVNDDGIVASGSLVVQGMMSAGQNGQPLALATPLAKVLGQLIGIVNGMTGGSAANALLPQLGTIAAKNASSV